MNKTKRQKRITRHRRVRAKIKGNIQRPRLSVFRSNRHIYIQLIDDESGKTLSSISDAAIKTKNKNSNITKSIAFEIGKKLAVNAKEKGIKKIIFDRGGYKFHGRISELARGAREGGLQF